MWKFLKKVFLPSYEDERAYPNVQEMFPLFPMRKLLKKAFWVPCGDGTTYPTVEKAHQAIAEYCAEKGHTYIFTEANEVIIDGIKHEIYRGFEPGSRGCYGVKCREK